MLQFKPLTINDGPVIRPYLLRARSRVSDCTVGGLIMWRDYFKAEYAIEEDTLFFKVVYVNGRPAFSVPLGDVGMGVAKLREYCGENAGEAEFVSVTETTLAELGKHCRFISVTHVRDWYDYLYESSDMINFPGKKYSGQRNHINKFTRMYNNYRFEPIGPDNIDKIISFLGVLFDDGTDDTSALEERGKVLEVFENYEAYGMFGGAVLVDEAVVALAAGEIMNDTLFVHIEKANRNYQGAYQVMVNEFARYYARGVRYINREEDMGKEGMRKSKLSYHPVKLLEKCTVLADLR